MTAPLQPWLRWLMVFGFWTLIGISFASQFYFSSLKLGQAVSWRQALGWALGDWYVFALLSVLVVRLVRRFPCAGPAWLGNVALHLPASALFSLAYMVLRAWVGQFQSWAAGQHLDFIAAFKPLLVKTWHFNLLVYWVMVSVTSAFDFYRKNQARDLRAAELEKRLAEARLLALQMQLNPHFLFNTLHSISALMYKDVDAADRMVTRLGELLRRSLDHSNSQEVPLRQELEFLQRYLEIEQIRFGDRLELSREIAPEALDALVPNLILQPLVENAIRHGLEPQTGPGRIVIRARREQEALQLEVADNGAGLKHGAALKEGVGLSNTRARLQELYGAAQRFELTSTSPHGLLVRLIIPLKYATARADRG